MSVGKYSPTVSASYAMDQTWWERNGGGYGNGKNPNSQDDDDGYDSYGYSNWGSGVDRAGILEDDYITGEYDEAERYHYPLYDRIAGEWAGLLLGDLPQYLTVKQIAERAEIDCSDFENTLEWTLRDARVITGMRYRIHCEDAQDILARYWAIRTRRP